VQAIDTATNRCVATIPVGQLPQALVYVPIAVASDKGRRTRGLLIWDVSIGASGAMSLHFPLGALDCYY